MTLLALGSVLALLGLGALHGVNPAMGWLFAVALGLQETRAPSGSSSPSPWRSAASCLWTWSGGWWPGPSSGSGSAASSDIVIPGTEGCGSARASSRCGPS